ncbi:MAG: glycosyl transferase family 1 [Candidatus Coatesbacteria bacterium]|nr:MAG: glycosyl transferase family 1 [Candidatus Coatesbacteria bacterium]
MLRILQVYKDYCPPIFGGIEKHIALLSNRLSRVANVDVLVANRGLRTELEVIDGIRVTKVGELGRFLSAPVSPLFGCYLGRERYDILHFHLPNPTAVISYLLVRPAGKVVVTWHSDIVRQAKFLPFYRPFLMRFLQLCDVILPTSERYARSSAYLSNFTAKCRPIPLGIDVSRFSLTDDVARQVKQLRAKFGDRIVLFVGRLRYYKGLKFLIDAMQLLDAKLLIVGDGPMRAELEKYSSSRDLGEKVLFVGEVDEKSLPVYYHCCDVFCLPSIYRSEAFGVSQIEAMTCGKPVVSTALDTGIEEVNLDGLTGLVVPPMDSKSLSRAIGLLLSDKALAARLGGFAQKRVFKQFTADRMAESVLSIYNRVVMQEQEGVQDSV